MKSIAMISIVVANLLVTSVDAKAKMKKYLWIQEIKPCTSDPEQAQVNGSFRYTGQGSLDADIDFNTPRTLAHLFLYVELKKCPTRLVTDDCEDLMSFPVGDQCYTENAYFKKLYTQFQPPLSCPVLGLYSARKVNVEADDYSLFFRGFADEEWLHARIGIYADEKTMSTNDICMVIIATMKKIRVQDRNNRKKKQ